MYNVVMKFSEFIEKKYIQWRGDKKGNAGSIARYARELGVEPYLLNDWMTRGKIPTDQAHVDRLVAVFGMDEVYGVLGWPVALSALPEDVRSRLAAALFEIRTKAASITDKESPEMEQLSNEVFSKYGFKSTRIE